MSATASDMGARGSSLQGAVPGERRRLARSVRGGRLGCGGPEDPAEVRFAGGTDRLAAAGHVSRGQGDVINVASTAGFPPTPTMTIHGASKAFVVSFTEALWVGPDQNDRRAGPGVVPWPHRNGVPAATDKQFLTRGRQTADQVAAVALTAYQSGRRPTVSPDGQLPASQRPPVRALLGDGPEDGSVTGPDPEWACTSGGRSVER